MGVKLSEGYAKSLVELDKEVGAYFVNLVLKRVKGMRRARRNEFPTVTVTTEKVTTKKKVRGYVRR